MPQLPGPVDVGHFQSDLKLIPLIRADQQVLTLDRVEPAHERAHSFDPRRWGAPCRLDSRLARLQLAWLTKHSDQGLVSQAWAEAGSAKDSLIRRGMDMHGRFSWPRQTSRALAR